MSKNKYYKYYYTIESDKFGGSGCEDSFDTIWAARHHASFWTEKEREGCYIVQYLKRNDEAVKIIKL
ncbi:MAG: hypothetical protein IJV22_06270 [Bacteroidales bacterium]|nr:hypothetical protein [Bacteroidales bacterium]